MRGVGGRSPKCDIPAAGFARVMTPAKCPCCGGGPLVYAGEVAASDCLAMVLAEGVDSS